MCNNIILLSIYNFIMAKDIKKQNSDAGLHKIWYVAFTGRLQQNVFLWSAAIVEMFVWIQTKHVSLTESKDWLYVDAVKV